MAADEVELEVGNRSVRISNPGRVYFPARGETKLDLVRYYLSVGDGIVRALRERPCMMHRFPSGVAGEKVHQKRVPHGAPPWLETVRVDFPRYGRHADELCVTELASVVWAVQMSTVEFHPWNSRRADVERPMSGASTWIPCRAASSPPCAGSPASCTRYSANSELPGGPRPRAARACTSTSGSSHGGALPSCDGPRTPSPARSNAARRTTSRPPGGARTVTPPCCSSTTTRTPATTRSPAPTRCAACLRRPYPPPSPGTRSTRSTHASSLSPPCPPASPSSATYTRASMTPPTRWTPCWNGQNATNSTRTAHNAPATARTIGRAAPAYASRPWSRPPRKHPGDEPPT